MHYANGIWKYRVAFYFIVYVNIWKVGKFRPLKYITSVYILRFSRSKFLNSVLRILSSY